MRISLIALVGAALFVAQPALAKVTQAGPARFVVEHNLKTKAPPARVWALFGQPSKWWSAAHSWSGDAANFSISLSPGGCFCEKLTDGGGVEHARVVMVAPEKLLRLSGALGPLQGEGVSGALTFTLKPTPDGGTEIDVRYAVTGDSGMPGEKIAAAVDSVIGEQARRLASAADATGGAPKE